MASLPIRAVGMVWYSLDDYAEIRRVMTDGDKLPPTFTQWRLSAEQGEKHLRRQGFVTVRAHINPQEFVAWCQERGLKVDASGRTEFANWVAKNAHGSTH